MKIFFKRFVFFLFSCICVFCIYASGTKDVDSAASDVEIVVMPPATDFVREFPDGNAESVKENWSYVSGTRTERFRLDMPITDVVMFSADLNSYGEFDPIPKRKDLGDYKGRVHLCVTCQSYSLTHFCIDPKYGVRDRIIADLVAFSKSFDGINMDFETIPKRDWKLYHDFIKKLRSSLDKSKMLTIAVPARVRTLENDAFDYKSLEPYVDRIFIMAYDEHWSTSAPGAVASTKWCERIAKYAVKVIPQEKLVMGLPFYGRSWQDVSFGKAWTFNSLTEMMANTDVGVIEREDGVPHFKFKKEVTVTGYFDDTFSLVSKIKLYKSLGIDKIGFWQVGQEDPTFWDWLKIAD